MMLRHRSIVLHEQRIHRFDLVARSMDFVHDDSDTNKNNVKILMLCYENVKSEYLTGMSFCHIHTYIHTSSSALAVG